MVNSRHALLLTFLVLA